MHAEAQTETKKPRARRKVTKPMLDEAKIAYARIKAELLETFPELADAENQDVLLDTLDGATTLTDLLVRMVKESREAEMMAKALKGRMAVMTKRRSRFERKNEKLREIVADEMVRMGGTVKLTDPEFNVGLQQTQPSFEINPFMLIPAAYCETKITPSKKLIVAAMEGIDPVEAVEASKLLVAIPPRKYIVIRAT